DVGHVDLPLWGVGWDYSGSATGSWHDGCEHGSHVAGTMLGRGNGIAKYRGNAPGLGGQPYLRHFNVKAFNDGCGFGGFSMASLISPFSSSFFDGTYTTPMPHFVTNSWGTCCAAWIGSEASARSIDDQVYSTGQLWIWAAGNNGAPSSVNLEASAKNSFTVGSVNDFTSGAGDPGVMSSFSSQGPTGDGRWKPSVCAPGDWITSVDANSTNGYKGLNGTSMATPHVAGVAAQVLDAFSWQHYAAERTESLLMATAITKGNQVLTTPGDTHLRQYGTGRVDSYRALYGTSELGWSNWGFYLTPANWTYADFTISSGATRLIVCMNYSEPSCSSGASKALVNNYDLYLDQDPIDPNGNTGDWFVQQSTVDNTEIRIIDNPQVGPWRWKIYPTSATGGAYFGLTVAVVYGDTTPAATVSLNPSKSTIKTFEVTHIDATVANPDFIASAVFLDTTSSGFVTGSHKYLGDGVYADMNGATDMELGDIVHGYTRTATYDVEWFSDGVYPFSAQARADNITSANATTFITVDGTPPALPTNLGSSTHTANVWSNNPNITFNWTASTDNLSGLAGYSILTANAATNPDTIQDIGAVTSNAQVLSTSASGYYFNIKPVDNAGNWNSSFANVGPFLVDTITPTNPSALSSPDHQINVPSCNSTITVNWTAGSDAHSGVKGYAFAWDHSASTNLTGMATNLSAGATSKTATLASSSSPYYFHLIIEDKALNYGTTQHFGPFFIDTNPVTTTSCPAKVNSLGCTPAIASTGAPSASATSGF
ncbi:MAG TPA: S8 family serine peptidase, partial [Acidimicrobiia bacterium]|nr:S8 family serine peptidase [Acidimicrobiia bacterium]